MINIDCNQWQQQQLKALSYIYLDQFQVVKQSAPYKFNVLCKPFGSNQLQYQLNIMFEFTQTYPKTPIKYQFQSVAGITRDNIKNITQKVQEIISLNLNRPIVYDIVEETRQWICQFLVEGKAYQQEQTQVKKIQEHFQRPKFNTYTPVTVESFLAWKKQFDQKHKKIKAQQKKEQKPTGKQWFLGKHDDQEQSDEDQDDEDLQQQINEVVTVPSEQNNDLF